MNLQRHIGRTKPPNPFGISALCLILALFPGLIVAGEPSETLNLERELRQERHWLSLDQDDYRRAAGRSPAASTPGVDEALRRQRDRQQALQQRQLNQLRALEAQPGSVGNYGPQAARKHLLLNRFESERRQQSQQQREIRHDWMMQDYRTYTPRPAPRIEALE